MRSLHSMLDAGGDEGQTVTPLNRPADLSIVSRQVVQLEVLSLSFGSLDEGASDEHKAYRFSLVSMIIALKIDLVLLQTARLSHLRKSISERKQLESAVLSLAVAAHNHLSLHLYHR